jgi:hypothetical protein
MAALVSTSSRLTRSVVDTLMRDDRLMQVFPQVEANIQDELKAVSEVPRDTWKILSVLGENIPTRLQHQSISSTVVQACFFTWRTRPSTELPWSLVRGDVEANLRELAAQPEPPGEAVSDKIWELARMGYPTAELIEAMTLWRNVSWSTKVEEEGHKQASSLVKLKHRIGEEQMRARSLAGVVASLVLPSMAAKRKARLRAQLGRVLRRNPQKIQAKQAYVSRLGACAKVKRAGMQQTQQRQRVLFKNHGKCWATMAPEHKAAFEAQAQRMRGTSREELRRKSYELRAQIDVLEKREQDAAKPLPPLRLGSCTLSNAQRDKLVAAYYDSAVTEAYVNEARVEACKPVGPPDPRRCAALDAIHVELEGAVIPGNRLPWLSFVCNNRGLFHDSCFKFTTPVGIVILKFVFALQRPMIIGFHRVIIIWLHNLLQRMKDFRVAIRTSGITTMFVTGTLGSSATMEASIVLGR